MNATFYRLLKKMPILPLIIIGTTLFHSENGFGQGKARVLSVEKYPATPDADNRVLLGDYLKITTENLYKPVKDTTQEAPTPILYLDDLPLKGVTPLSQVGDSAKSTMIFKVARSPESQESWKIVYHFPWQAEKDVRFSVGFGGKSTAAANKNILTRFVLVRKRMLVASIIGFVLLLAGFFVLAIKSDLLKDSTQDTSIKKKPYSLSRTQLAYWTVIIVIAYVFIWVVTGELSPISGSTLVLLGISIGTTAGAKLVDSSQNERARHQDSDSVSFIQDILSDDNGISVHRFQMVLWTFVLGIIFIRHVVLNAEMPQLDDNLLALMGISNTTYVGLKIPENANKPPAATENPDDSDAEPPAVG